MSQIELIRLDSQTGEERIFFRRVVKVPITLDALKKRANRLGLKYEIRLIRITYKGRVYHRVVHQENGVSVLGVRWYKEKRE